MGSLHELLAVQTGYVKLTKYANEFATIEAVRNGPPVEVEMMRFQTLFWFNSLNSGPQKYDIAKSNRYRDLGNKLFQADKKQNALAASRLYTQAIFAAPPGETMALAHANRAMALQEFGYFQQAYDDCECALEQNYPVKLRHKLWTRQAYCARQLGNAALLQKHLDALTYMPLNEKFVKEFEKLGEGLKELKLNDVKPVVRNQQETPVDENRDTQEILKNKEKGRYMVAKKLITTNSLIFNERATSFVPVDKVGVCQQCASTLLIPFPCFACHGEVIYCSLKCRRAHSNIHQYECFGYRMNLFENVGLAHIACRIVIDHKPELSSVIRRMHTAAAIWAELMQLENTAYTQSMQMITHLEKLPIHEILWFALLANVMVEYLTDFTNFFHDLSEFRLSRKDLQQVTGSLILRHMGQLIVNGHTCASIRRIHSVENRIESDLMCDNLWASPGHVILGQLHQFGQIDKVIVANFPYLSLCNHSCTKYLQPKFSGRYISIFAVKPIKAGEEIFNTYVNDHRRYMHKNRWNNLKQVYHFECKCYQCTKENPDEDFLKFHRYRCDKASCRKVFTPRLKHREHLDWWIYENDEVIEVNCPFCSSPQRWNERNFMFRLLIQGVKNPKKRQELFQFFDRLDDWLLDYNKLKYCYANEIIKECYAAHLAGSHLSYSEFVRLSKIIKLIFDAISEQKFTNDMEYVVKMAYLWDFIALGKYKPTEDEMKSMLKVLEIASDEIQQIFLNYYNDFIVDKLKK